MPFLLIFLCFFSAVLPETDVITKMQLLLQKRHWLSMQEKYPDACIEDAGRSVPIKDITSITQEWIDGNLALTDDKVRQFYTLIGSIYNEWLFVIVEIFDSIVRIKKVSQREDDYNQVTALLKTYDLLFDRMYYSLFFIRNMYTSDADREIDQNVSKAIVTLQSSEADLDLVENLNGFETKLVAAKLFLNKYKNLYTGMPNEQSKTTTLAIIRQAVEHILSVQRSPEDEFKKLTDYFEKHQMECLINFSKLGFLYNNGIITIK